jgi:hypothetical protein
MLDAACAHDWARNELRRRLRSQRLLAARAARRGQRQREQRWRQAAEASGSSLEQWITSVLDDAARSRSDNGTA